MPESSGSIIGRPVIGLGADEFMGFQPVVRMHLVTHAVLLSVVALMPTVLSFANRGTVVLLVIAAVGSAIDFGRQRRLPPLAAFPFLLGLAALISLAAVSAAWEETPGLALPKAAALAGLFVCGLLVAGAAKAMDQPARNRMLTAASYGLIVAGGLIILEIKLGFVISAALHKISTSAPLPQMLPAKFKPAASVLTIWGILVAGAAVIRGRLAMAGVIVAISAAIALLTDSFAAKFAVGAGVFVWGIGLIRPRVAAAGVALGVIAGIASAPLAAFIPEPLEFSLNNPHLPNSALHRAMIWRFSALRVQERPVFGWGFDASRSIPGGDDVSPTYVRSSPTSPPVLLSIQNLPLHPHNFAIQVWLELGAVGALVIAAIIASLVRLAERNAPKPDAAVMLGTIAAAVTVASVAFGAWQSWWLASLWMIGALAAGVRVKDPGAG